MTINNEGMNNDYVKNFNLEEYVSRIKLSSYLLEHLEDTNRDFDDYMKKMAKYDEEYIINYWIFLLYNELRATRAIENKKFDKTQMDGISYYFDTLSINNSRIHELHNFVVKGEMEPTFSYRNVPVNVSRFTPNGEEEIFWRGVNPEDVQKFMTEFIKIYKQGGTSLLFGNPFLASALMHLLFVRIHPYSDGNGRTARMIHNIKFTEMVNKLYGTRLKLSPLNLSKSIRINRGSYVNCINNIYFDIEHDTNDAINRWFNFALNMADEQIYYSSNLLDKINVSKLKNFSLEDEKSINGTSMRLSRIKSL